MFDKKEFELFKKYCQIDAISSYENNIAKILKEDYLKLGYELVLDNIGNIYAYKKSKTKNSYKVLIDAHMDEVGFIVMSILDNGLIRCMPIGGISLEAISGQRFKLTNQDFKQFIGTVDLVSLTKDIKLNQVNFNFGFKDKKEAVDNNINIGDMVSFIGDTILINNQKQIMSKAIDDRYGIVLGLEILSYFKDKELPFDLYVGGSVCEEVGLRGAKVSANHIKPDLCIVLDCSPSRSSVNEDGKLGDGLLLRYFDPTMIARPSLLRLQEKSIKNVDGKYQYFKSLGGTNAGVFHTSNEGIKTLTHCICAVNLHSANSIIDSDDYHNSKLSLINIIENLTNEDIKNILDNA